MASSTVSPASAMRFFKSGKEPPPLAYSWMASTQGSMAWYPAWAATSTSLTIPSFWPRMVAVLKQKRKGALGLEVVAALEVCAALVRGAAAAAPRSRPVRAIASRREIEGEGMDLLGLRCRMGRELAWNKALLQILGEDPRQ